MKNKEPKGFRSPQIHHLYPTSRQNSIEGFKFNVTQTENEKSIDGRMHEAWHKLFSNMTPREQLRFVYRMNEDILSPEIRELMEVVVNTREKAFYLNSLIKFL